MFEFPMVGPKFFFRDCFKRVLKGPQFLRIISHIPCFKVAFSSLRQFMVMATKSPLKMMKNVFYFT